VLATPINATDAGYSALAHGLLWTIGVEIHGPRNKLRASAVCGIKHKDVFVAIWQQGKVQGNAVGLLPKAGCVFY